jgi:hypothetical protein
MEPRDFIWSDAIANGLPDQSDGGPGLSRDWRRTSSQWETPSFRSIRPRNWSTSQCRSGSPSARCFDCLARPRRLLPRMAHSEGGRARCPIPDGPVGLDAGREGVLRSAAAAPWREDEPAHPAKTASGLLESMESLGNSGMQSSRRRLEPMSTRFLRGARFFTEPPALASSNIPAIPISRLAASRSAPNVTTSRTPGVRAVGDPWPGPVAGSCFRALKE